MDLPVEPVSAPVHGDVVALLSVAGIFAGAALATMLLCPDKR
jgi:hypothetical protein